MVGQTLGDLYSILAELGSGGQTYLAQDSRHPEQLRVVLRRWLPGSGAQADPSAAQALFRQELALRERLGSHEGIPSLLGSLEQEGEWYWVEEWIEGRTLEDLLGPGGADASVRRQTWPEAEVRAFLLEVLQALAFLHEQGVAHAHLQPCHLICRQEDGRWLLLGVGGGEAGMAALGCRPGQKPEESPDLSSDLHALGLIVLQILSGIPPQEWFRDPLTGELRWQDRVCVSAPFAAFLERLLGSDGRQRFACAGEALAALRALPSGDGSAALLSDPASDPVAVAADPLHEPTTPPRSPVSLRARPWIPPVWAIGGAVALLVLALAGSWQMRGAPPAPRIRGVWGERRAALTPTPPPTDPRPAEAARPGSLASPGPVLEPADWASSLQLKATLEGPAAITALAMSSDGNLLAAGGDDGVVKLWDPRAGRLLESLVGHEGSVETLAISGDGTFLVSGGADKTVRVWDLTGGMAERLQLRGHGDLVNSVAISPDNRWIASGSADRTIRLWEAESGRLIRTLDGSAHEAPQGSGITAVAFGPAPLSASGSDLSWILAAANGDPTVDLWDPAGGRLIQTLQADFPIEQVLLSPEGRHLLGSSASGILVWNLDTGALERTLAQRLPSMATLALSPDGRLLASGSDHQAQAIKLWDLHTGELLRTLGGSRWMVSALLFAPDGQTLFSGGVDGSIRIWSP